MKTKSFGLNTGVSFMRLPESCLCIYWDLRVCASVSNPEVSTRNSIFARVACGDVTSELLSGTLVLAVRRDEPGG